MIAHNIVLTLCFILLGFACLAVAFLAAMGGPEGGSDSKLAMRFVYCAVAAAVGIVLLWLVGEWSWLFWFYLVANVVAPIEFYRSELTGD